MKVKYKKVVSGPCFISKDYLSFWFVKVNSVFLPIQWFELIWIGGKSNCVLTTSVWKVFSAPKNSHRIKQRELSKRIPPKSIIFRFASVYLSVCRIEISIGKCRVLLLYYADTAFIITSGGHYGSAGAPSLPCTGPY